MARTCATTIVSTLEPHTEDTTADHTEEDEDAACAAGPRDARPSTGSATACARLREPADTRDPEADLNQEAVPIWRELLGMAPAASDVEAHGLTEAQRARIQTQFQRWTLFDRTFMLVGLQYYVAVLVQEVAGMVFASDMPLAIAGANQPTGPAATTVGDDTREVDQHSPDASSKKDDSYSEPEAVPDDDEDGDDDLVTLQLYAHTVQDHESTSTTPTPTTSTTSTPATSTTTPTRTSCNRPPSLFQEAPVWAPPSCSSSTP